MSATQDLPTPEPLPHREVTYAAGGGLALERELQARLFASEGAREGIAAFVEQRSPRFEGR